MQKARLKNKQANKNAKHHLKKEVYKHQPKQTEKLNKQKHLKSKPNHFSKAPPKNPPMAKQTKTFFLLALLDAQQTQPKQTINQAS